MNQFEIGVVTYAISVNDNYYGGGGGYLQGGSPFSQTGSPGGMRVRLFKPTLKKGDSNAAQRTEISNSLRPFTIAQINHATQAHTDAEWRVDDVEIGQVSASDLGVLLTVTTTRLGLHCRPSCFHSKADNKLCLHTG